MKPCSDRTFQSDSFSKTAEINASLLTLGGRGQVCVDVEHLILLNRICFHLKMNEMKVSIWSILNLTAGGMPWQNVLSSWLLLLLGCLRIEFGIRIASPAPCLLTQGIEHPLLWVKYKSRARLNRKKKNSVEIRMWKCSWRKSIICRTMQGSLLLTSSYNVCVCVCVCEFSYNVCPSHQSQLHSGYGSNERTSWLLKYLLGCLFMSSWRVCVSVCVCVCVCVCVQCATPLFVKHSSFAQETLVPEDSSTFSPERRDKDGGKNTLSVSQGTCVSLRPRISSAAFCVSAFSTGQRP